MGTEDFKNCCATHAMCSVILMTKSSVRTSKHNRTPQIHILHAITFRKSFTARTPSNSFALTGSLADTSILTCRCKPICPGRATWR